MWHCASCSKRSCNASGDGNPNCPKFVFDYDWPTCGPNCEGEEEDTKPKKKAKKKKPPRKKKAVTKKEKKQEKEKEEEEELLDDDYDSNKETMMGGVLAALALVGLAVAFIMRK